MNTALFLTGAADFVRRELCAELMRRQYSATQCDRIIAMRGGVFQL